MLLISPVSFVWKPVLTGHQGRTPGVSGDEWGQPHGSASLSNLCHQRSSSQAPERTLQHPGISQGESQTPFRAQNQHYLERDRDKWNIIHGGVQGRWCSHLQKMAGTQLSPCPESSPFVTGNVQNEIVCRDSQTMVLRSSSCVGLGSLQLFFRLGFEFTWNTAHLHAVRQKVTFLSVANRNFAEKKKKKLVLLFINCSQIWYLLKSCLYKKCIKVHWQNQRKKLRVPFNLLASRMWDRQVASSLFPEVTWS